MKQKLPILCEGMCICGALLLLSHLSSAAPIEKSDKTKFVPDEISRVEPEFRNVAAMGKLAGALMSPQDPDRIALLQTTVPSTFLKYMRNFVRPEFVPAESYVRENLMFARGVDVSRLNRPYRGGDAAYLAYRCVDRDFLIAQTYDDVQSVIGISISLNPDERFDLDRQEKIKGVLEALRDTYLLPDPKAPFDLTEVRSEHFDATLIGAKLPQGKPNNYRQTLKGTYTSAGVCFVFKKLPFYPEGYKDVLPAFVLPADKYFDRMLGRYEVPAP